MENIRESLNDQERISVDLILEQSTALAQLITLLLETLSSCALQTPHAVGHFYYLWSAPFSVSFTSPSSISSH